MEHKGQIIKRILVVGITMACIIVSIEYSINKQQNIEKMENQTTVSE